MSDAGDRILREAVRLIVREEVRAILAEERQGGAAAVSGFVGTEEAARIADVEQATVRAWVKSKRLAARKLDGVRGWKILRSDLEAFLSGAHTGAEPPDSPPLDLAAHRLVSSIRRGQ